MSIEPPRTYTEDELDDYFLAEDMMREAKGIVEALRTMGFEGEKNGYELGAEIYEEVELAVKNGTVDQHRIEELGAEIFREYGWPSPTISRDAIESL